MKWTCQLCGLGPIDVDNGTKIVHHRCLTGPGTELKKLLASYGITPEAGCGCDDHAREMDQRGVEWCQENIDTIVGWMREEAAKRKLPFVAAAAKWLARRAIREAT